MKKYFFTGLVILLPLAVTLWVVYFVVNFLTKPFMGIVALLLSRFPFLLALNEKGIRTLSQILILIGLFLLTLFLGFVARRLFFHQLLQFGDRILKRIPLVNKVYKTSKEIIQSLFFSDRPTFKQVVMLPFPHKGCYSLGIITADSPTTCTKSAGQEMISVFIPTTPNPTTGFLVMTPKSELIFLKMKSEDAVKYVVSCGVIQPERQRG